MNQHKLEFPQHLFRIYSNLNLKLFFCSKKEEVLTIKLDILNKTVEVNMQFIKNYLIFFNIFKIIYVTYRLEI